MSEEQLECARCGDAVKSVVASEIKCWRTNSHQGICVMCEKDEERFAAQVCEQREKKVNDKWERDVGHDWDAIGHALKMPPHIPRRLTEILQAIEATELALQTLKREHSQLNLKLDGWNQERDELQLALQAASEEHEELMAAVKTERNSWRRVAVIDKIKECFWIGWSDTPVMGNYPKLEVRESKLSALLESEKAQARQQAIVECAEVAAEFKGSFDIAGEIERRIRSLTPPPALTKEK